KLDKTPGIAETLDWASGLLALGYQELNEESIEKSLGCILKSHDDIESIKSQGVGAILEEVTLI
ncbi:MAG: MoxR family ATPase, partial [Bacteroidota bacterium]